MFSSGLYGGRKNRSALCSLNQRSRVSWADAVMDGSVVAHDDGGPAIALPNQRIKKLFDVRTFDAVGVSRVDQAVLPVVERAEHGAAAVTVRFNAMGQSSW